MASSGIPSILKPVADLAVTNDKKWRAAKIIFEKLGRKIGFRVGDTETLKKMASFLKAQLGDSVPAHWMEDALGVIAATYIQSPHSLAVAMAKYTGQSQNVAIFDELFNESVDSAVMSVVESAVKDPTNDAQLAALADKHLESLAADKKFDGFKANLSKKIAILNGIPHDMDVCPVVQALLAKQGARKIGFVPPGEKEETIPKEVDTERVVIVTLEKAIEKDYDLLVEPRCCGGVRKVYEDLKRQPADLFAIIAKLNAPNTPDDLKDARRHYYGAIKQITAAQNDKLHDIGSRMVWTPEKVGPLLLWAVVTGPPPHLDLDLFLRLLSVHEKPVPKPFVDSARGWLERNARALLEDENELRWKHPEHDLVKARKAIAKFTDGMRERGAELRTKRLRRKLRLQEQR